MCEKYLAPLYASQSKSPTLLNEPLDPPIPNGRGHARVNRTVAALMRRGLDSELANRLLKLGMTLDLLKQKEDDELRSLGLTAAQIKAIQEGERSAIPFDTLVDVLWANRSTCCVCRVPARPIIIHHITPWAKSRDHRAENLAVLCLEHHAKAHQQSSLEQNLGERQVREFKRRWEEEVRHLDPRAILDATRVDGHHWWWFNRVRLLEMVQDLGIDLAGPPHYATRVMREWVELDGQLLARHFNRPYLYSGGDGENLYLFMRQVIRMVFERTTIFNVSDDLDPGFLRRVVRPGDLILIRGKHSFRGSTWRASGPGQLCEVDRQANGVRVSFVVDRWEAVSTSSWGAWLYGTVLAASVVRIVRVDREGELLHLRCTGIAVGSSLQGLSVRQYAHATWPDRTGDDYSEMWNDDFNSVGEQ